MWSISRRTREIHIDLMNKKILVLEKNKDILELLDIVLKDEGYITHLISSDHEVFKYVNEFQPDAILLDIINPSEEGTSICKQIKESDTHGHIPVIVLSTHPRIAVVKEICADEVVTKPFDISFLLSVLADQFQS